MRSLLLALALLLVPALPAHATFSIVAIDPITGDLGVAVASRYFAVGAVVPWADAGVGAVATQAGVNVGYGTRALELLRQGLTAQQVLDKLLAEDTFPARMRARLPSSTPRATWPCSRETRPTHGEGTSKARPGRRRATSSSVSTSSRRWAARSKALATSSPKSCTRRSRRETTPEATAAGVSRRRFWWCARAADAIPTTIATCSSTSTITPIRCTSCGGCSTCR